MGLCLGSARVWRLDRRFNVRPAGGCGAGPADGSTPGGPCRFVVLVHTVAAPTDHSPGRRAGGDGDAGCERMLWPRQAASSTICVSAPDGPNDCATTPAWNPAQVFVTASKLTGRFTATAKGCWQVTSVMGGNYTCAPLGPVITTI